MTDAVPPPPPTASASTTASPWTTQRVVALLLLLLFVLFGIWWFFLRDGGAEDFTAIDATAQGLQQECFNAGLFYDQFGNCYRVDPATIDPVNRPSAVVAAVVAAPEDEETEDAVASGGGTTGQANPSGGSSGGSSSGGTTGQANPSGGSSGGGQSSTGGGSSTGQSDPGGGSGTTEPSPSQTATTTASPSPSPSQTTSPSPSPSPSPTATPIVASERNEWAFRWSPTVPDGGCGPDSRVNGQLSEECQDYQRAYGNSSNFSCDHGSDGRMFCTQQDGNRDMVVEGTVTLTSANLSRYVPNQDRSNTSEMSGSVTTGSDPGFVCSMAGSMTEVVFRNDGSTGRVPGTWNSSRNAPGC